MTTSEHKPKYPASEYTFVTLTSEQILLELEKEEEINYIATLYGVPVWRVKQKINQGVSLSELELMYEYQSEM